MAVTTRSQTRSRRSSARIGARSLPSNYFINSVRERLPQFERRFLQLEAHLIRLRAHQVRRARLPPALASRLLEIEDFQHVEQILAGQVPAPQYTPPKQDEISAETLWALTRTTAQRTREQNGATLPNFGPLSHYRHFFQAALGPHQRVGTEIVRLVGHQLFVFGKKGATSKPRDPVLLIEYKCIQRLLIVDLAGLHREGVWKRKKNLSFTMKRVAIDSFFKPAVKKSKYEPSLEKSSHASYPFAIPHLPAPFMDQLGFAPSHEGKQMNDQPHLDLVYYQPYIPTSITAGLFGFLRQELPFYRVQYDITRGTVKTQINTPRYTTVFGVDETSCFSAEGTVIDAKSGKNVNPQYKCKPRPIPQCLDELRKITEGTTGETFNFCLVNYYADGKDSISYHSDDERFLGPNPAIASFSLGAKRDFLMKHKPIASKEGVVVEELKTITLPLSPGDMVLMRGTTQANWLHSIPKRAGLDSSRGRINITFRKAMVKGGTENYYQYNVGTGPCFKWDAKAQKMMPWAETAPGTEASGNVGAS